MSDLKGQVALVTGGGSGIGRGICLDLAQQGVKVMVLDLNEEAAKETQKLIKDTDGYAEVYKTDVTDAKVIDDVVGKIYQKHQRIDILVSNAGINSPPAFVTNYPAEDWEKHIKIHLYQAFYFTKACGAIMKKQKYGRIVVTSSLAGYHGMAGGIAYAAGKTGLVGFTYTAAKEFGPYGVTVNAIQPGLIWTPLCEAALGPASADFAKATPIPRMGQPKDVANVVTFLCKPESEFLTGLIIRVDGGYIIQSGMDMMCMEYLKSLES